MPDGKEEERLDNSPRVANYKKAAMSVGCELLPVPQDELVAIYQQVIKLKLGLDRARGMYAKPRPASRPGALCGRDCVRQRPTVRACQIVNCCAERCLYVIMLRESGPGDGIDVQK